ncbi:hypothetical protein [Lunatimonas lonarensis]|uniref:hypothetical protein n=1 Tax=Lunatimonas lonarensis TaxID=1232681 RepID=UPI000565298F|nr:hypothetical protein [Lunatimonas lonarensis]
MENSSRPAAVRHDGCYTFYEVYRTCEIPLTLGEAVLALGTGKVVSAINHRQVKKMPVSGYRNRKQAVALLLQMTTGSLS